MSKQTSNQKYYDLEIELCADYRPKDIIRPENVWQSVADIQNVYAGNASHVQYARTLVAREKMPGFPEKILRQKTNKTIVGINHGNPAKLFVLPC